MSDITKTEKKILSTMRAKFTEDGTSIDAGEQLILDRMETLFQGKGTATQAAALATLNTASIDAVKILMKDNPQFVAAYPAVKEHMDKSFENYETAKLESKKTKISKKSDPQYSDKLEKWLEAEKNTQQAHAIATESYAATASLWDKVIAVENTEAANVSASAWMLASHRVPELEATIKKNLPKPKTRQ
jgi:hypothetical protein